MQDIQDVMQQFVDFIREDVEANLNFSKQQSVTYALGYMVSLIGITVDQLPKAQQKRFREELQRRMEYARRPPCD